MPLLFLLWKINPNHCNQCCYHRSVSPNHQVARNPWSPIAPDASILTLVPTASATLVMIAADKFCVIIIKKLPAPPWYDRETLLVIKMEAGSCHDSSEEIKLAKTLASYTSNRAKRRYGNVHNDTTECREKGIRAKDPPEVWLQSFSLDRTQSVSKRTCGRHGKEDTVLAIICLVYSTHDAHGAMNSNGKPCVARTMKKRTKVSGVIEKTPTTCRIIGQVKEPTINDFSGARSIRDPKMTSARPLAVLYGQTSQGSSLLLVSGAF